MDAPTPTPTSVRQWFRQMRTADHLRDPSGFDAIRTYARGEHAIVYVNAQDPALRLTLFDRDVPEGVDVEAEARLIQSHHWGIGRRRLRQSWTWVTE